MSLKAFHVLFVIVATLGVLGFAVWAFFRGFAVTGVLSIVAAGALVFYGLWFLRKMKNVSYL